MLNTMNYDIDITKEPPADDTARQYYFIEKAKAYVQRESEELGRPLTFCVTTFGCQMTPVIPKNSVESWKRSVM